MSSSAKITLGITGVLLLVGLGLVVLGTRPPPERTFKGTVKDLLPKPEEIPGWTVEYQPIADTPEMKDKVTELLNYDDAVFAVYTKGSHRLSVYIAYWAPGKMSHRLVAGHTPDVCWVGAGWQIREADRRALDGGRTTDGGGQMTAGSAEPLALVLANIAPLMQSPNNSGATALPPAEFRIMELNRTVEHVAFWHLLDGNVKSYGTGGTAPWYAIFTDVFSMRLNQQPEQFFIRVSGQISEL